VNDPKKHHYLPVFYLKRWARNPDGKLVSFRKWPRGRINPLRLHPPGIGYQSLLYSLKGKPDALAQQLETSFMKPVDTMASEALDQLEAQGGRGPWNNRLRQAWAMFIRSLFLRMPSDIEALKVTLRDNWVLIAKDYEEGYQLLRKPSDPATVVEFAAQSADRLENMAIQAVPGLANNQHVTELLMNLHWFVTDVRADDFELLTGDRPVKMSPLLLDDAFVSLPIGPRKMFWGVRYPSLESYVRLNQSRGWPAVQNRELLRRSNHLAIARNDGPLAFVRKHLAAEPTRSHFEGIDLRME
jgi:hypothetical protein